MDSNLRPVYQRVLREMEAWRGLKHPNVLPFIGLYEHGSTMYMVSPWMENGVLKEYIQRKPDIDRKGLVGVFLLLSNQLTFLFTHRRRYYKLQRDFITFTHSTQWSFMAIFESYASYLLSLSALEFDSEIPFLYT